MDTVMSDTLEQPVSFPVPFAAFAATLKGTPDEVYTKLLKIKYGSVPRDPSEWQSLLQVERAAPAYGH